MFELLKTEGKARRGVFTCAHGTVQTPVFMNVGTQGAIKGALSAEDLKNIGCQVELSNTAHFTHHLIGGTQVQMVGVGQFYLAADVLQVFGAKGAFNGTLCADVHKYRGLDRTMGAGEFAPACLSLGFLQLKHKYLN